MNRVVRINNVVKNNIYVQSILGLNLFRANGVETMLENDPRINFISEIFKQQPCSAHVGTLALEGSEPEEIFGASTNENSYVRTKIGPYLGNFEE